MYVIFGQAIYGQYFYSGIIEEAKEISAVADIQLEAVLSPYYIVNADIDASIVLSSQLQFVPVVLEEIGAYAQLEGVGANLLVVDEQCSSDAVFGALLAPVAVIVERFSADAVLSAEAINSSIVSYDAVAEIVFSSWMRAFPQAVIDLYGELVLVSKVDGKLVITGSLEAVQRIVDVLEGRMVRL